MLFFRTGVELAYTKGLLYSPWQVTPDGFNAILLLLGEIYCNVCILWVLPFIDLKVKVQEKNEN